jgi:hypothetical protein
MSWAEISADLTTWTMPGGRTKNGVPHVVPLSGSARERMLPEDATEADRAVAGHRASGALVFPGLMGSPFAGWSKAKDALDNPITDARAKAAAEATTHQRVCLGTRTVAAGLQRLGIRLEVTEAVLNHISGSRAGIPSPAQQLALAMLNNLAAFCNRPVAVRANAQSTAQVIADQGAAGDRNSFD